MTTNVAICELNIAIRTEKSDQRIFIYDGKIGPLQILKIK